MNELKILFSDEYRLFTSIKGEVREALKDVNELLDCSWDEWGDLTMRVTAIANYAERISAMCAAIEENANIFLSGGPYLYQTLKQTPLEALADE